MVVDWRYCRLDSLSCLNIRGNGGRVPPEKCGLEQERDRRLSVPWRHCDSGAVDDYEGVRSVRRMKVIGIILIISGII